MQTYGEAISEITRATPNCQCGSVNEKVRSSELQSRRELSGRLAAVLYCDAGMASIASAPIDKAWPNDDAVSTMYRA